ncbi:hypothetical protein COPCOM_01160 [Coprococcus comes ATCC 27758]|uniref:Uncharacterized protein n=1 Tax=Coprococcus comes ATCC 27758 TaxID=470146 RepID=C0B7N7_9FIRM|nr:hypothetical protein COPCOM_01160 [Coprococcus comes ATCC 27758]
MHIFSEFLFYKKSDYQAICHFPDNPILFYLHLKCFLYTVIMQKLSFCRKCLNFI